MQQSDESSSSMHNLLKGLLFRSQTFFTGPCRSVAVRRLRDA
jgi:hypothetical protein